MTTICTIMKKERTEKMGIGYGYKCSKCGYSFRMMNGIGMMFPFYYKETVQQAKDGKLGTGIQQFFVEHPDGEINAEYVTLCCCSCGRLVNDMDLTMYIPKKDSPRKIKTGRVAAKSAFQEREYVMSDELVNFYDEYAKYVHECTECGGKMRVIGDNEQLICPKCRTTFEPSSEIIMWD